MNTILDEDVPHQLRNALAPRHEVVTVSFMGWSGVKNGALLKLVEGGGFNVFVTGDKNIEAQQHIVRRPFAVLVLSAIRWKTIRHHIPVIADAIDTAKPGMVTRVECGRFRPSKFDRPAI